MFIYLLFSVALMNKVVLVVMVGITNKRMYTLYSLLSKLFCTYWPINSYEVMKKRIFF